MILYYFVVVVVTVVYFNLLTLTFLAVVNPLQLLPFYDLDDREFSFVIGNWTGQFDELMSSDLYNLPYYTHFEITGDPCSLIGPQQCDLFPSRTIFCSKSHHSCSKSHHFCFSFLTKQLLYQ